MTSVPNRRFCIGDVWCSGSGCSCRPRTGQLPSFNEHWWAYSIAFVELSLEASKKLMRIEDLWFGRNLESDK